MQNKKQPIIGSEVEMSEHRVFSDAEKRIKALEVTKAYAEYKLRHAGDLEGDYSGWPGNLTRFIEKEKAKK